MKRIHKLNIFLLSLFFTLNLNAQVSSCPNADFESGDFSNWQGSTGSCCPINNLTNGIIPERHTIMSGAGFDPNTGNNIPVVAPGGLYSARLGNANTGGEAETLTYSINVDASNSLFIYKYAVVLQDPDHEEDEQPRFQINVLNSAGVVIDPTCGQYTVVSGDNIPGFQTYPPTGGDIRYKTWTTVGLDLSSYIGQNLTIEFATGDCSLGGHFGYAYIDAYCSPLQINSTFCSGSFEAVLSAPIGFTYLWSNGSTSQSINISNPTVGSTYSCILTSVTGCTVTISTVLTLYVPVADYTVTNTCYDDAVFTNTTFVPSGTTLNNFLWDFGDGSTSNLENPTHSYASPGTYTVSFTISNAFGCISTKTIPVTVVQSPTANFNYGTASTFCNSDTSIKNAILTGTNNYTGGVYTSSPAGLSINNSTGNITPNLSMAGTYIVSYSIPTENNCTVPPSTKTITILESPTVNISYSNPTFCGNLTNLQLVNLTGTGAYSGGVFSSTPGLTINSSTGSINPSTSIAGNYLVTYTLNPSICPTLITTTNVTIKAFPTAAISYSSVAFCSTLVTPQPITLTGTLNYTGGVFSAPSGLSINSTNGNINPNASTPGTYIVTYTIPSISDCILSVATTTVVITKLPTAAINYSNIAFCKDITVPQNVILTGTDAYTSGTYSSTSGLVINSTTGAIIPSSSTAGNYVITYTTNPSGGCSAVLATTNVKINALPMPILKNGDLCINPSGILVRDYILDSGLNNTDYSFVWALNGTIISGANQNTYTATNPGNYSLIATNIATGCASSQVFATVTNIQMANDFVTSLDDTFTDHNVLTVMVTGGSGPFLYQLDSQPFQTSNIFTSLESGIHLITVTDTSNCTILTKEVTVFGYPKFFTPNGDSYNDFWNIYSYNNLPEAKIYIFDRFGKLIKQLSPVSQGWDGTFNGTALPSTDYWFTIEYINLSNKGILENKSFKSHFSLKR